MVEIYEIDTEHFNVDIPRGKTIVKVVLLEDYNKAIQEAKKEVIDYLDNLSSLKSRLVEEGIHQRKPISVITLNKIFDEVNRQIKQRHTPTKEQAK